MLSFIQNMPVRQMIQHYHLTHRHVLVQLYFAPASTLSSRAVAIPVAA